MAADPSTGTRGELLASGEACPNIALVKYWGKRDPDLNLPAADSLAVVLDQPATRISLYAADQDRVVWLDPGGAREDRPTERHLAMLDRVRGSLDQAPVGLRIEIESGVPPGAGLASSAAEAAALAMALDGAFSLGWSREGLSALARLGSGSGARSVPGGFVRWSAGHRIDGEDSYARTLLSPDGWRGLCLLMVILDPGRKSVSSTDGMRRTRETSPLYEDWIRACRADLAEALEAVLARDLFRLAVVVERNAAFMHAAALTAAPPILYMGQTTVDCWSAAVELRRSGIPVCCTLDAGPNPILITTEERLEEVRNRMQMIFPAARFFQARPGPGARQVEAP